MFTIPPMTANGRPPAADEINKDVNQSVVTTTGIPQALQTNIQTSNAAQLFPAGLVPQLVLAATPTPSQTPTTPTMLPMQQLLIPVSTGSGSHQFITIPVSLTGTSGHSIQLLTTSNGQVIATNITLPNLQAIPALASTSVPLSTTNSPTARSSVSSTTVQNGEMSSITHNASSVSNQLASSFLTAAQTPYFLAPHVLPPNILPSQPLSYIPMTTLSSHITSPKRQPTSTAASHHVSEESTSSSVNYNVHSSAEVELPRKCPRPGSTSDIPINYSLNQQSRQHPVILQSPPANASHNKQVLMTSNSPQNTTTSELLTSNTNSDVSHPPQQTHQSLSSQNNAQEEVSSANDVQRSNSFNDDIPPSICDLMPNTVNNASESTTVDGINLDEIKEFAKSFKLRRLSLGLTQTQVGQALSATEGPAYSQSAICRFEKLDITPKSAQKIKPVLEKWMREAEQRHKNGYQNLTDFMGCESSKKRKRRTSFTPSALDVLNEFFEKTTHPSGEDMTRLSKKLNYDREVIRVWFCNKRQALKNTIKKLRQDRFERAQMEHSGQIEIADIKDGDHAEAGRG